MSIKFYSEKKVKIETLLGKLHEIAIVKEDDTVSYTTLHYIELKWTFLSLIDFGQPSLSEFSKGQILGQAVEIAALEKINDQKSFLNTLNKCLQNHNKPKERDFFLLTSISVESLPIRKIKVGSSEITITGKNFPRKFINSRNRLHDKIFKKKEKNDYLKAVVKTRARNFHDAFEEAHSNFEVFRAIICLSTNFGLQIQLSGNSDKPINRVVHGEFLSLHHEDGNTVHERTYWYTAEFKLQKKLLLENQEKKILQRSIKRSISLFNRSKSKHQTLLKNTLNLYVSAFDESNKYVGFLKSWTALETITNTYQNDILIKRSISLLDENTRDYQRQVLEGLKVFRNRYVHKGNNNQNPLMACFQIQRYLRLLINFNLKYVGFFENAEDSTLFLDNLNSNVSALKRKRDIIEKALTRTLLSK